MKSRSVLVIGPSHGPGGVASAEVRKASGDEVESIAATMKPKRCRLKKEAQEARGKTGLMAAGKAVDMPES